MQTRAAYARVKAAVEALQREKPKLRLPKPQGRLTVEQILSAARHEGAGPQWRQLRSGSPASRWRSSAVRLGQVDARAHPGRLPVPTAGKVRLDGTELRNWDRRQFGEYTGYLPQEVELFPGTSSENVCRMRDDLPDDEHLRARR